MINEIISIIPPQLKDHFKFIRNHIPLVRSSPLNRDANNHQRAAHGTTPTIVRTLLNYLTALIVCRRVRRSLRCPIRPFVLAARAVGRSPIP